jgi:hypothetical protein
MNLSKGFTKTFNLVDFVRNRFRIHLKQRPINDRPLKVNTLDFE